VTDDEIVVCRSYSVQTSNSPPHGSRRHGRWRRPRLGIRRSITSCGFVTWTSLTAGSGSTGAPRRNLVGVRSATGELPSSRGGWGASRTRSPTTPPLVYEGSGSEESRQVSSCIAVAQTLTRAGIGKEPDVRPGRWWRWRAEGQPGGRVSLVGLPTDR
jgi:hypothetical protein